MKLKKILAQTLAAAMVLTSIPVADFTVFAAEDVAAYVSDDAGTDAATETDALPAPYGYTNLQLTVGTDVEITTSANTTITASNGNVLAANGDSRLEFSNSGDKWINFHFQEAKKVSGLLYKNRYQTNGPVKIARVDVKKQGSDAYVTVYQTETASEWTNPNGGAVHEALFNTVSDVTDVKFYAVATHYSGEGNRDTVKADVMRILTTEDDSAVTATALTSDENSGTATVSIPGSTVSDTTMSVSKGVTVKYQAKEADAGKFAGWCDETGRIVSNDATYTTTVSDNITLTAVFKDYYEKIDQSVLKANAKDNSHDNNGNDRAASAAFDGNDNTLWHQNWGSGNQYAAGSKEKPSASNPIWIQTSFGTENGKNKVETVGRLTYRGRPDSYANQAQTKGLLSTRISDYVILAANVAEGSPKAGDWAVVQKGTMPSDIEVGNAVSEVEFAPVNATHIRLVCLSTYDNDNYVCAGEINLYRVTDSTYGADLMDLGITVNQGENGNGNAAIVAPGYQTLNDANETAASGESASVIGKYMLGKPGKIQLLAVPASGYAFASWKVNNEIVSKEAAYLIDTDSDATYQPEFTQAANYTEITIPTDGGSSTANPSNIRTNSETKPAADKDGPAYWAFDEDETTHWHSNWKENTITEENKNGKISVTGPIWIEAGFNVVKKVAKITYMPRKGGSCRAKGYEVLVANMTNPKDKPQESDFAVVKTGELKSADSQDIVLPTPVKATHVRLRFTSSYDGQTYVSARKIRMYEDSANTDKYADIVDIPTVTSNNDTLGTVKTSVQKIVDKIDNSITMTATPKDNCHFVKWLITDEVTGEVSEKSAKSITETVNNNTRYAYTAMFAKDAEVNVNLDQTYVTMYVGDNDQTLAAAVTNAANTGVTWSTDNDQVATVTGGIVRAVGAGEATITATSEQDDTKKATCTVVVNVKPSTNTLLTLINDADSKKDETTKYTAASRSKLASALEEAAGVNLKDEAAIKQAENTLRDALDNLEELYMIRVNVAETDGKAEITTAGDDGKIHREGDNTYIYAPLMKLVTVRADATNKTDVPFVHWYLDPDFKVMSTSTSYSFYVVGNMTFSAKYDADKTDPEVNLFCSTKYSTAAGKRSFIAKRSVDKTYTVVEHGVIVTDEKGWNDYYKNDQTAMIKDATRTRKAVAKGTANIGTYEAKLKAGKKEKWYGRSYVTYTNGYKTYTEYSDIVDYQNHTM